MAKEKRESTEEGPEAGQLPSPELSISSPDERTSAVSVDALEKLIARLDRIEENLPASIEKAVQSLKDSRLNKVEPLIAARDDLLRLKSYVDGAGGDWERGLREMRIDEFLASRSGRSREPSPGREASEDERRLAEESATVIVQGAGMSLDDPGLKELAARSWKSYDDWKSAVKGYVEEWKSKGKPPNPATLVSEGGGSVGPKPPVSDDDLVAQIAEHQRNFPLDRKGRAEMIAEARRRGIWSK